MITLDRFSAEDISQFLAIRNDESTRRFLHDDRTFTETEANQWYETNKSSYLVVRFEGQVAGYMRIGQRDYLNRTIAVGCDIHPEYRRGGIARLAYDIFLKYLWKCGWRKVWLEVLDNNEPALRLYRSLGFKEEGRRQAAVFRQDQYLESILMCQFSPYVHTGRSVKVVTTYFGDRRQSPPNAGECRRMLEYWWRQEQELDPGLPMDTLLVHNMLNGDEPVSNLSDVQRCIEFIHGIAGLPTKRGRVLLLERPNIGLSFGGFSEAFGKYRESYDFWLFLEDDQIIVKPNVAYACIEQLLRNGTVAAPVGFVGVVGVSGEDQYPPHCHGGCGMAFREVLLDVWNSNYSEALKDGHLPWHNVTGYANQEHLGEIRFTNAIHRCGYELQSLEHEAIYVSWGERIPRNSRCVPWEDSRQ